MTDLKSDLMLDALAAVVGAADGIPALHRNAVLDDALEAIDGGALAYVNMVDSDVRVIGEALGTVEGYELEQEVKFEITVKASSEPAARAATGAIVDAVHGAITAATGEGGALEDLGCWADITGLQRDNLATQGIPGIKGVLLTVTMTFISDRPF